MRHRLSLFTNYCLPSVLGQTDQNFVWLIFFDEKTPRRWLGRMKSLLAIPNIVMVLVNSHKRLSSATLRFTPHTIHYLVTTRLDNDDFLGTDFVRNLREAISEDKQMPYILDVAEIYAIKETTLRMAKKEMRDSPLGKATSYATLVEKRQKAKTCHSYNHMRLRAQIQRYELVAGCCVGKVVHDWNLFKRNTHGEPITEDTITELKNRFPINSTRIEKLLRSGRRRSHRSTLLT